MISVDEFINRLKNKMRGNYILLNEKPIVSKKIDYDLAGNPTTTDVTTGIVRIEVKPAVIYELYEDILSDNKTNKLQRMKEKLFYDSVGNVIEKGYSKYLERWINEGLNLD